MKYLLLAVFWSIWCFFHSWLITISVSNYLKHSGKFRFYRISYNVFALVSFCAVWFYSQTFAVIIIYNPSGLLFFIQMIVFALSLILFVVGAKNYDMKQFIGLNQLSQKNISIGIGMYGQFRQDGILQYSRHPWYLASLLILWTGFESLTMTRLTMNIVFTLYIFIGTLLEEKKLVAEFGESYRAYQKKVPMYFPLNFFKDK